MERHQSVEHLPLSSRITQMIRRLRRTTRDGYRKDCFCLPACKTKLNIPPVALGCRLDQADGDTDGRRFSIPPGHPTLSHAYAKTSRLSPRWNRVAFSIRRSGYRSAQLTDHRHLLQLQHYCLPRALGVHAHVCPTQLLERSKGRVRQSTVHGRACGAVKLIALASESVLGPTTLPSGVARRTTMELSNTLTHCWMVGRFNVWNDGEVRRDVSWVRAVVHGAGMRAAT